MPQKTHAQPVFGAWKWFRTECVLDGATPLGDSDGSTKTNTNHRRPLNSTLDCPIPLNQYTDAYGSWDRKLQMNE